MSHYIQTKSRVVDVYHETTEKCNLRLIISCSKHVCNWVKVCVNVSPRVVNN